MMYTKHWLWQNWPKLNIKRNAFNLMVRILSSCYIVLYCRHFNFFSLSPFFPTFRFQLAGLFVYSFQLFKHSICLIACERCDTETKMNLILFQGECCNKNSVCTNWILRCILNARMHKMKEEKNRNNIMMHLQTIHKFFVWWSRCDASSELWK